MESQWCSTRRRRCRRSRTLGASPARWAPISPSSRAARESGDRNREGWWSGRPSGSSGSWRSARRSTRPRAAKASRELIVGLLTAVELMSTRSVAEIYAETEARLQTIQDHLVELPGLAVRRHFGTDVGKSFHHL